MPGVEGRPDIEITSGSEMSHEQETPGEEKPAGSEKPAEEPEDKSGAPAEKKEEAPPEDSSAKGKGRFQERIDELTHDKHEWRRKAEAAEAELAKYKGKPPEKPAEESPAADDSKEPLEDEFDDWDDYRKAFMEYTVKLAAREGRQAAETAWKEFQSGQEKAAAEAKENEHRDKISKKFEDGRKKYKDFDDVALKQDLYNDAMLDFVTESPHTVELAYHLGKNPETAEKILNMSPVNAVRELVKIEMQFETQNNNNSQNKGKHASGNPPIPSIAGAGDITKRNPQDLAKDPVEWRKWRESGGGK